MQGIKFTVRLIPITKKNSQRIIINKKTGKPFPIPSKAYEKYEKEAGWFLKPLGIDYPVNVQCLFYMPTRRRVDLVNLLEAIDDIMVKYDVIKDDNFNVVAGHDGSRVLYDKDNPRTEIIITPMTKKGENDGEV